MSNCQAPLSLHIMEQSFSFWAHDHGNFQVSTSFRVHRLGLYLPQFWVIADNCHESGMRRTIRYLHLSNPDLQFFVAKQQIFYWIEFIFVDWLQRCLMQLSCHLPRSWFARRMSQQHQCLLDQTWVKSLWTRLFLSKLKVYGLKDSLRGKDHPALIQPLFYHEVFPFH